MIYLLAEATPDAPSDLRIYVAIAGILIMTLTLFRMNRRRRARIAASGEASSTPLAGPKRNPAPQRQREHDDVPTAAEVGTSAVRDLQGVMVQMQEITREVEGRLDTRVRFAQRLLQQSEESADRLERLLARVRDLEASGRLEVGSVESRPAEESPARADEDPVGQNLDVVSAPASSVADVQQKPDREEVLELSAAGKSAPEIAAETGLPIGEVELIVNLGKARKKTP